MSCVYLIWQDGTSHYKIGKADKPAKRLKDLQTGHSGKLHLVAQMECKDALRKEVYLHQKYRKFRVNGEWFNIPPTALHQVFAEFQFHVQETPDECIYYWVAQAKSWQKVAADNLRCIRTLHETFFDLEGFEQVMNQKSHELLVKLIEIMPADLSLEMLGGYHADIAEVQLLAGQVGILPCQSRV